LGGVARIIAPRGPECQLTAETAIFRLECIKRIPAEIAFAADDILGEAGRRDETKSQSGHSGQKGFVHVVLPLHMATLCRVKLPHTTLQNVLATKTFLPAQLRKRALTCGGKEGYIKWLNCQAV
jgi:hypothetical protein